MRPLARSLALLTLLSLAAAPGSAQPTPTPSAPPEVLFVRPPTIALPPAIDARQRALDVHLVELADDDRGRTINGWVQVGLGAAFVTGVAFVPSEIARSLLWLIGAEALVHGAVQLTLAPRAGEPARAYRAMPLRTADEARARIRYGEQSLRDLALAGRRTRIVDGTVTMAVAATYVPLLFWMERRAEDGYAFGDNVFDFVALAISTINLGTGLVTALVPSEAERRARAYDALRDEAEQREPGALERLSRGPVRATALRLTGRRDGLVLGLRTTF